MPAGGNRGRHDELGRVLSEAVGRAIDGATSVEVLFSGGLDSSLVAHLAARTTVVRLLTIGMPGASDLAAAERAAGRLGLELRSQVLDREVVERAAARWGADLADCEGPLYSVALAFALALASARGPIVLTGQGADELFFGYAHFRRLPPSAAAERRRVDLRLLIDREWPRAERIAQSLALHARAPFLDPAVQSLAMELAPPEISSADAPKAFLRAVAVGLGLPPELASASKKAMQYGSGIDRFLRRRS